MNIYIKVLKFIVIICFLLPVFSYSNYDKVTWITEEYPPYNYREDGKLKGIAVDTLLALWKKLGIKKTTKDIKIMPWPRGLKLIKTRPNTCLFATAITDNRKNKYGWKFVFPIPQESKVSNHHLIARRSVNIRFYKSNYIKEYKKEFGVLKGDIGESFLLEVGVPQSKLNKTSTPESLIKKLDAGRFDIISYGKTTTFKIMKKLKIDTFLYESVFQFSYRTLGFAFHRKFDDKKVSVMQKALDELHKEGVIKELEKKYFRSSK